MRLPKISPVAALLVLAAIIGIVLPVALRGHKTAHVCTITNTTLECVLKHQAPAPPLGRFAAQAPAVARGIDFAWDMPSISSFRANGWTFAAGYLSFDPSKNLSRGRVALLHANGIATVFVWETTAQRAQAGWRAGFSDARQASSQLAALGAPAGMPFDMAVDCDCPGVTILGYFQGANAAVGRARVGAYGGYFQIKYLHDHDAVNGLNWQTYAWSQGLWLPAWVAPLEQWLNGSVYDNDRAIAKDFAQWPRPTPPPPPRPHCFGPHAQLANPTCKRIRPIVSRQSRARDVTLRVMNRRHCPYSGINGQHQAAPLFHTYPVCRRLAQRASFFAGRIHAELY